MIYICLLIICAFSKITTKPVQWPILFEPIFFETVPIVQGKRVYWEQSNVIEGDPLLSRATRQNVAIAFPDQPNSERSRLPATITPQIEFPASKVDERLVLGHMTKEETETSVTSGPMDMESGTTDLGISNSTFKDHECLLKDGLIFYRDNCSRLLSDIPCESANQWLIINQFEMPECVERPCPVEQLLYEGTCYQTSDNSMCNTSEILYVDFTGYVYCDCEQGLIFDGNQCVAEHQQGSCRDGYFVEFKDGISCVPNPCFSDDLVKNPADEKCYRKTFEGKCDPGLQYTLELTFNSEDSTATCSLTDTIATRNIFEIQSMMSCPAGSKRNFMNECKEAFLTFAMPSQFTARYSICPPMHIRLPSGTCKKVNKMI